MPLSAPSTMTLHKLRTGDLRALIGTSKALYVMADADSTLVRQGEPSKVLAIVTGGWACHSAVLADGRKQMLDVLVPGDAFGLEGILGERSWGTVSALTAVRYRPVQPAAFLRYLGESRKAALILAGYLLRERERRNTHALMLGRLSAVERIARFLVEIRARLRERRLGDGTIFPLPMTQAQIGYYLALTAVHVNRVLRQLRQAGVVVLRERHVRVLDWAALERLALVPAIE